MTPPADVVARIAALPEGTTHGIAHGARYVTSKTSLASARAVKVVAERLEGGDYISLNLYHLQSGPRLYPCEMPAEKVIRFLRDFVPQTG